MEGFVSDLAQRMCSAAAAPGDLVVKQGEVGNVLFILLTGSVRVFTDSNIAGKSLYEITAKDESPFFGFVEMMMYISNPMGEDNAQSHASVEALNFCDLAYVDREGFTDAIAEVEEIKEAFIGMAVKKVRDAKQRGSRKSYADIPVLLGEEDGGGSSRSRARSKSSGGPSLSQRIGSERRNGHAGDFDNMFSFDEDSDGGAIGAALEAASTAADATTRHGQVMKQKLDALEKRIDTELASVHGTLSQILQEVARLKEPGGATQAQTIGT